MKTVFKENVDFFNAVGVDRHTNEIYVVGMTGTLTVEGQTAPGLYNIVVVKYDANGAEIWTKLYGDANGDEHINYLAVDVYSGDFFLCGSTTGDWHDNLNNDQTYLSGDSLVVRLNPAGEEKWSRMWGSTADDFCWGLGLSVDGKYVYASGYKGSAGGNQDASFTQINAKTGSIMWSDTIVGSGDDVFTSALPLSANEIFAVGYISVALDQATFIGGTSDIAVVKYTDKGERVWSKLYGTKDADLAYYSSLDAANKRIYIAGIYLDADEDTGHLCLVISAETGSLLFSNDLNSIGIDVFSSSWFDPESNLFYAAGMAYGGSVGPYYSGGKRDSVLITYNASAYPVKVETWGTANDDYIQGAGGSSLTGKIVMAGAFDVFASVQFYQFRDPKPSKPVGSRPSLPSGEDNAKPATAPIPIIAASVAGVFAVAAIGMAVFLYYKKQRPKAATMVSSKDVLVSSTDTGTGNTVATASGTQEGITFKNLFFP